MDYSPPGSSVPGDSPGKNTGVGCHCFLQGSSWPSDQTWVSWIVGRFFTNWATREAPVLLGGSKEIIHVKQLVLCLIYTQFSSVAQSCPTLCNLMNRSTPGLPVDHQLLEFTQTHVHQVSHATQPSHPLSSSSPTAFNLSQHQGLFKWVSSSHQVAKVLDFQLQHQSFLWTPRTDLP